MKILTPAVAAVERASLWILRGCCAFLLLCMMVLTCADVAGRYFFNAPVFGALEATEVLLAAVIFMGIPMVSIRNEHITINLFDSVLPPALFRIQNVLVNLIGTLCSVFIAWQLWSRAEGMLLSGEMTAQLEIRLGWLTVLMAVAMGLTAMAFAVAALRKEHQCNDAVAGGHS